MGEKMNNVKEATATARPTKLPIKSLWNMILIESLPKKS